jgi:pimeloyl-ACP methyl ester carboxylesterase
MADITHSILYVGDGEARRPIAIEQRPGSAPGLFWLGGFRSDMAGTKAMRLDAIGAERGAEVTRFDYSGHGRSGGDFNDGTISRWLEEALEVFSMTHGQQVVVGSSMGGWLALLLQKALLAREASRVRALVLIAPAADMTEALMLEGFTKKERRAFEKDGYVEQPSDYSDEPYRINRKLIEDGRQHLMFGSPIDMGVPMTILQGAKDRDVPKEHAFRLMQHLLTDPVTFTLVPDGDHRLSRDEDLKLLEAAVVRALEWD